MKKNFTRTLAFCALFIAFVNVKAQDSDLLKTFINKNSIAVKAVQKNLMQASDPQKIEVLKELIKLQVISVKLYQNNKAVSTSSAYKVRENSLDFLSKNSKGNIDYYKFTEEEKNNFGNPTKFESPSKYLSKKEISNIESLNYLDPSIFNSLTISIQ